jgi:hypothetical protein
MVSLMTQPSAKRRCVWIVLALFSAIAVVGNGLHFLPGLGHDCEEADGPVAVCGVVAASQSTENSAAGPWRTKRIALQDGSAISALPGRSDCPVCQFFTQAQTVPLTVSVEIDFGVVEGRWLSIRPLLVDPVVGAYHSRAPPAGG